MRPRAIALVSVVTALAAATAAAFRAPVSSQQDAARRAAIHPVADDANLRGWLARVPLTRQFPPDFTDTLRGQARAFVIEMSTTPGCIPCGDMWIKLQGFGRQYGWRVAAIGSQQAMLRSGRLGLPWVGHPVVWVRPVTDANRIVPVAIGTDHGPNLARNVYLAVKMLTGVRPDVGLRAMSKYTGIVGAGGAADRVKPGKLSMAGQLPLHLSRARGSPPCLLVPSAPANT